MGRLEGKTAIVTGAARGIGAATVAKLAAEGARVVAADVDSRKLNELRKDLRNADISTLAIDLCSDDAGDQIAAKALDTFGSIDIIVNNAGFVSPGAIHKMSDEQFLGQLNVHLVAPFRLLRAAGTSMIAAARQESQSGVEVFRKVVNVSSLLAISGQAMSSNYGAAKGGVIGLTRALANEWGRYRINVNCVAFGLISTRLSGAGDDGSEIAIGDARINLGDIGRLAAEGVSRIPLGRMGTPAEAADAIFLFCLPESNYVTGETLIVSGGLR